MNDLLKHLRSVHYFIVIASVTLIYIGIIAGGQYSVLISEINHLDNYIKRLDLTDDNAHPALQIVNTDFNNAYKKRLHKELDSIPYHKDLNIDAFLFEDAYKPLEMVSTASFRKLPLLDLMEQLESYQFEALVLDKPIDSVEIDWPVPNSGNIDLKGADVQWTADNKAIVTFSSEVYKRGGGAEGSTVLPGSFDVQFSTRKEIIRFSDKWFNTKHETLLEFRDDFGLNTIDELRTISRAKMGSDISSKADKSPINLLGIKFEGEHIGVIGGLIILIALIYLSLYIRELHRVIKKNGKKPGADAILWIGMMDSPLALLFCFISLTVLPAGAVGLLFYKFILSSVGVFFPTLLILILGVYIYNLLLSVRKTYTS